MKCSHNVPVSCGQPDLQQVAPCEPAAPWIGGKKRLARRICQILAATAHDAYAEPCVGMGGVFFRRAMRPRVEIINDASGDVVNLFRILQRHPEALLRELRWRPAMRAEFDRLKAATAGDGLTDVERAARFLYLQRLAFGGKVTGRNFGTDASQPQNFDLARLEPRLAQLHGRLAGVVIEHLDWSDLIRIYDRPRTVFYLDPPYWGSEDDYGKAMFAPEDFARLAAALRQIQGAFLLSINDVPEIRELFSWADLEAVDVTYTVARGAPAKFGELLIGRGVNLAAAGGQGFLF